VVETSGLENRHGASHREFESHRLRSGNNKCYSIVSSHRLWRDLAESDGNLTASAKVLSKKN
jgi:hypothetical protein